MSAMNTNINAPFRSSTLRKKWFALDGSYDGFVSFMTFLTARLRFPVMPSSASSAHSSASASGSSSLLLPAAFGGSEAEAFDENVAEYANKVWTRDSALVAMAMKIAGVPTEEAATPIRALADVYERPENAKCMQTLIDNPNATYNDETCAPIRFDCETGNRTDPWGHMQLDAIGLFLLAVVDLGLADTYIALVKRFVLYLYAVGYWNREDRGHWEENSSNGARFSSIGCCVAGLRAAEEALRRNGDDETATVAKHASELGNAVVQDRLQDPSGPTEDWGNIRKQNGRKYDSAVCTVLFPTVAKYLRLTHEQGLSIFVHYRKLVRKQGIARYENDAYYTANFQQQLTAWREQNDGVRWPPGDLMASWAVPGKEAQWTIFEPLLLSGAIAVNICSQSCFSMRRILASIEEEADGDDVKFHVHESYVFVNDELEPNDIRDLLWGIAYVRMALKLFHDKLKESKTFEEQLEQILKEEIVLTGVKPPEYANREHVSL